MTHLPNALDEIVTSLQKRDPLPPLYPKSFDADLSRRIQSAADTELFGSKVLSSQQKQLLRAGLLVWNDDFNAAHPIVQDIENATGSFWHAIIHRREGDAANSNYWWRRTGEHAAFDDVLRVAQSTLDGQSEGAAREFLATLNSEGRWLPMEFVTRCELARKGNLPDEWLRRVQVAEMEALLNWCRSHS